MVLPNGADLIGTGVERFQFDDGTRLSLPELLALAPPRPEHVPTYDYLFEATGEIGRGLWGVQDWAAINVGSGISAADVRVKRDGEDLLLDHADGADTLRLYGWYADPVTRPTMDLRFADGTVWTAGDLTVLGLRVDGTEEADMLTSLPAFPNTLVGFGGDDTLTGNTGDDRLDGGVDDALWRAVSETMFTWSILLPTSSPRMPTKAPTR